jgi:hypothetical protein
MTKATMTDYRAAAWMWMRARGSDSLESLDADLVRHSDEELADACLKIWKAADGLDRELLIRAIGELREEVENDHKFAHALWD